MTSTDFAAAQKRLLARRAAATQSTTTPPAITTPNLFTRLPAPLRELLTPLTTRTGTAPAFRVGQVDAELLDEELLTLLKSQVGDALKYYGQHLRDDWDAEILLALRAVLFKLTVWDHGASYGAALQNLRFVDARRVGKGGLSNAPPTGVQKAMYGLLSVGGRYAWHKWEERLLDLESGYEEPSALMRRLGTATAQLGTLHSVAALVSFLAFLVNGKYRTLLDRVLRLRLTPTTAHVSREVSFEYLNRQLVWHAFTEFLLFILPLVGISRWRRWVGRTWRKIAMFWRRMRGGDGQEEGEDEMKGELSFLPERTCAICHKDQNPTGAEGQLAGAGGGVLGSANTDITNPYMAVPCGCVYCFVCLAQRLDAEDGEAWTCLRCGRLVKECAPWHGDVVVADDPTRGGERNGDKEQEFTKLDPIPMPDGREQELAREIENELEEEAMADEDDTHNDKMYVDGEAEASWVQADREQTSSDAEEEEEENEPDEDHEGETEDPGASLIS